MPRPANAQIQEAAPSPASTTAAASSGWMAFWFTPANPLGVHALRVLTGVLFLAWLLPLAGQVQAFFGTNGWVDTEAFLNVSKLQNAQPGAIAPIGWSIFFLCGNNVGLINTLYWVGIVAIVLFTLGLATRVTSVLTWIFVVSFLANPGSRLEVDYLMVIAAFYLMIGYLLLGQFGRQLTLIERILGGKDTFVFASLLGWKQGDEPASRAANLAVRLFQVHFALIVVTSGLHKLQFGDWWSGVALWYPLHGPFETTADDIRRAAPNAINMLFVLSLVQYLAVGWQISFPAWAWRQRWRVVLLGGAVLGWLACAFIYKTPLFGAFYMLGCLSFLTASEWLRMRGLFAAGLHKVTHKGAAEKPVALRS